MGIPCVPGQGDRRDRVEGDVHRTCFPQHRARMGLDCLFVESVHLRRLRSPARGANVIGDRLDRREMATSQKDLRAFASERSCHRAADRTARPVDDRVLVPEHHDFSLCAAFAAVVRGFLLLAIGDSKRVRSPSRGRDRSDRAPAAKTSAPQWFALGTLAGFAGLPFRRVPIQDHADHNDGQLQKGRESGVWGTRKRGDLRLPPREGDYLVPATVRPGDICDAYSSGSASSSDASSAMYGTYRKSRIAFTCSPSSVSSMKYPGRSSPGWRKAATTSRPSSHAGTRRQPSCAAYWLTY